MPMAKSDIYLRPVPTGQAANGFGSFVPGMTHPAQSSVACAPNRQIQPLAAPSRELRDKAFKPNRLDCLTMEYRRLEHNFMTKAPRAQSRRELVRNIEQKSFELSCLVVSVQKSTQNKSKLNELDNCIEVLRREWSLYYQAGYLAFAKCKVIDPDTCRRKVRYVISDSETAKTRAFSIYSRIMETVNELGKIVGAMKRAVAQSKTAQEN